MVCDEGEVGCGFATGARSDGKRNLVKWLPRRHLIRDPDSGTCRPYGRSPIRYPNLCQHRMTPYLAHNRKLSG